MDAADVTTVIIFSAIIVFPDLLRVCDGHESEESESVHMNERESLCWTELSESNSVERTESLLGKKAYYVGVI